MKKITIFMVALLMVSATSVQAEIIGEWHLGEGSGTTASDSSVYGNHGTISGASWVAGICGSALNFDGTGDYVAVPDAPSLDLTGGLTIEAWVRAGVAIVSSTQMQIVDKGEHVSPAGDGYMLMIYNGDLYGRVNKNNSTACIAAYNDDGEWHHVAYTFESGEQNLYIDGTVVASNSGVTTIVPNADTLLIGTGVSRPQLDWDGDIDEIRMYNEALTAEQIAALFAEGCGAGLEKEITNGPGVDVDGNIDVVVEVGQASTTEYDFTITYSGPEEVLIVDTVPADWDVVYVESDNSDDEVDWFLTGKGKKTKSATKIEWRPASGSSSLLVCVDSRPRGRSGKFTPNSCGALYLNEDGAEVYEVDPETGKPLRDPVTGEKLPPILVSNPLCLAAVEDFNGDGVIARDGSGDEDGDSLTDFAEACEFGTSPCNPDTDGDGVDDGEDPDPLDPWNPPPDGS